MSKIEPDLPSGYSGIVTSLKELRCISAATSPAGGNQRDGRM
ncbi:hypothetical protein AB0323_10635 [Arthrobacter sp. NPDC080031]